MDTKIGYLIDMDGVIYRGNSLIAGADRFVQNLVASDTPFLFLTNNSQRNRRDVQMRLRPDGNRCGGGPYFHLRDGDGPVPGAAKAATGRHTSLARADCFMRCTRTATRSSITTRIMSSSGEGRTFTMEMVEAAVRMIDKGAKLVATNLDPNCPTSHGPRPGCGAIVAMLETATGIKAFSVGKPSPVMMRTARKQLGLETEQTIMIGDTMETDIVGGVQMGYRTVLVLSGGTRREDLAHYAFRPDMVTESLADLCDSSFLQTLAAA